MKIEMGESLIYSWLRHIKQCQIAQLNWKVSDKWEYQHIDDLKNIIDEIQNRFGEPFGRISKIDQIFKSSEVDVIGFDFNNQNLYGVDVAFHSNGLGYDDNVKRITKKILRTLLVFKCYFDNSFNKTVIFATPKINPTPQNQLNKRLVELKNFIDDFELNTKIEVISNHDFEDKILNPILSLSNDVADTSELFLRSYQLTQMFGNRQKPIHTPKNGDDLDSEIKIGKLVKITFSELFENNCLSDEEIKKLMDLEYSQRVFNLNYSLLTLNEDDIFDENGYRRYYADPYGKQYWLCNDWYESQRNLFNEWLKSIL